MGRGDRRSLAAMAGKALWHQKLVDHHMSQVYMAIFMQDDQVVSVTNCNLQYFKNSIFQDFGDFKNLCCRIYEWQETAMPIDTQSYRSLPR